MPSEDMNAIQLRISGETFPEVILEVCDNCNWSLQCINHKGIVRTCPNCRSKVSLIPMNIDEICSLQHDDRRGMTMIFDRRKTNVIRQIAFERKGSATFLSLKENPITMHTSAISR